MQFDSLDDIRAFCRAAVAILLARVALACHTGMATFTEAGVSGTED
jgi:hypothetical protein